MRYLTILYRLAVALWLGGAALFTFVLTPALFSGFDRDMAGKIVGVLFPGYFLWGLLCGLAALGALGFLKIQRKSLPTAILAAMLLVTSIQAFYIEPKAAELKKEIPSFVTTPADHPKRQEFRNLHAISSAGNLGVISGGLALLLLF